MTAIIVYPLLIVLLDEEIDSRGAPRSHEGSTQHQKRMSGWTVTSWQEYAARLPALLGGCVHINLP